MADNNQSWFEIPDSASKDQNKNSNQRGSRGRKGGKSSKKSGR